MQIYTFLFQTTQIILYDSSICRILSSKPAIKNRKNVYNNYFSLNFAKQFCNRYYHTSYTFRFNIVPLWQLDVRNKHISQFSRTIDVFEKMFKEIKR